MFLSYLKGTLQGHLLSPSYKCPAYQIYAQQFKFSFVLTEIIFLRVDNLSKYFFWTI